LQTAIPGLSQTEDGNGSHNDIHFKRLYKLIVGQLCEAYLGLFFHGGLYIQDRYLSCI